MIGRILKLVANEYLRSRRARTGSGPRRLPPTSVGEAGRRAAKSLIRMALDRATKR